MDGGARFRIAYSNQKFSLLAQVEAKLVTFPCVKLNSKKAIGQEKLGGNLANREKKEKWKVECSLPTVLLKQPGSDWKF